MNNITENNVKIGDITLLFVEMTKCKDERNQQPVFAVPGGGRIVGRANAIRAAKAMINSNSTLRAKKFKAVRNA